MMITDVGARVSPAGEARPRQRGMSGRAGCHICRQMSSEISAFLIKMRLLPANRGITQRHQTIFIDAKKGMR